MKYCELINNCFDTGSGSSTNLLVRCKKKEQLDDVCEKLNEKDGWEDNGDYNEFVVNEIDTDNIPDSLTAEEIKKLKESLPLISYITYLIQLH